MSLSTKVLLGMALGILVGVFFGEEVAFFQTLGDAFIRLLQMSVLPYMTISLILGLGSLKFSEALSLAKQCGFLLLGFWIICLAVVLLMPLAFPDWESASFFSTSLVQEKQEFDFLKLYIPANPFQSMANTIVPAVVLFSIALGVALIGVEKKQGLLETLSSLLSALTIITNFVVGLAPIGVFAIAASAAGTMNVEDLGRLQVYLVTYIAVTFVLTFWILPGLVAALTPLTYRQVLSPTRDALVTAFATGNLLVVLPNPSRAEQRVAPPLRLDSGRHPVISRCDCAGLLQLPEPWEVAQPQFCPVCRLVLRSRGFGCPVPGLRDIGLSQFLWGSDRGIAVPP